MSVPPKTEEDLKSDEAMRLSAELSLLSGQQYEALQRAPYRRMSDPERDAYDRRRLRIGELCSLLTEVQTKRRIPQFLRNPFRQGLLGRSAYSGNSDGVTCITSGGVFRGSRSCGPSYLSGATLHAFMPSAG
jgi:hypothetical protein